MSGVWPVYRALVGVGLLCGLVIVSVYEITAPMIARNRAEALHRAIFEAAPGAASSRAFRWTGDELAPTDESTDGERVFAAYDSDGALVGVAIEGEGPGYQDRVKLLYGYSPSADAIVGFVVLESRETPGLGDKIESDDAFRANFERLDVSLADDGEHLAHPIKAVKSGTKTAAHEIDSITGATISSVAVANIIEASAERWIPRIEKSLATLERPPTEAPRALPARSP